MTEESNKISKKAGLSPGTLVHVGRKKAEKVKITRITYNATEYSENTCTSLENCFQISNPDLVHWINIDGLHDTETIAQAGKAFSLHPLLLEDVLNTKHRPKIEEFDSYIFIALKMLGINKETSTVYTEHFSFVLGKNWLLSFQEKESKLFKSLSLRLKENKGLGRQRKADYLLYRLMDTLVDDYFFITEYISDEIDKLEEEILSNPDNESRNKIQNLKKQLLKIRKASGPLREVISRLQKDSEEMVAESTSRYLIDLYEHVIHINETVEAQRDSLAGIMDLYLSGISNKMNQVMQVLTIIATIFIPLTFIAGVYGMNFVNMPELHWKYGYFEVLGLMFVIFIFMLLYFRKKRWL